MSDQFGSNLNSLEYALTGHNEQEFIENLQIDIPKMEHQPAIIEMERLEQPSNVSPTVSPRIENPQKQIIPDQQNILVSFLCSQIDHNSYIFEAEPDWFAKSSAQCSRKSFF